jgi:hypothetical protein
VSRQRYFKLTPKGRAPRVTRVWPADSDGAAFDVLLLLSFALGLLFAAASFPEARYSRAYLLLGMACVLLVWLSLVAGKPRRAGARR